MAEHINPYPPLEDEDGNDVEAFVRGDPASFIMRVQIAGVDQDITTWTWRSHVRKKPDGTLIAECEDFDVVTPDDLPSLFPTGGTTPCVLVARWDEAKTALWVDGMGADIEQMTPVHDTWLIIDRLRVDKDFSHTTDEP